MQSRARVRLLTVSIQAVEEKLGFPSPFSEATARGRRD